MTDMLPGVHPQDRSGADAPVGPQDQAPSYATAPAPFSVPNKDALPVFERSARNGSALVVPISQHQGGTARAVGRLKGRKAVMIWVSSTATAGCMLDFSEGRLQGGGGVPLNPGDSVTLPTEASVYVGLQPGDSSATVNVIELYNGGDE
jgi:hypothetical protein